MNHSKDLQKSKLTWTSETVVNQLTQYKHKSSGDILTFYDKCHKPFQKVSLQTYKRVSDGQLFDYSDSEVERISQ